jgi:hypothetical protein
MKQREGRSAAAEGCRLAAAQTFDEYEGCQVTQCDNESAEKYLCCIRITQSIKPDAQLTGLAWGMLVDRPMDGERKQR